MPQHFVIHGLPTSLARDGWWLDEPNSPDPDRQARASMSCIPPPIGLVLLVGLADMLFWHYRLGISVAVFAAAVFLVATATYRAQRSLWYPTAILAMACAPTLNHVQPLSLGFLGIGLACSLVLLRRSDRSFATLIAMTAGLLRSLPRRWLSALNLPRLRKRIPELRTGILGMVPRKLVGDWAFPIAGTLVFAALLMQANPVLARVLDIEIDVWTMVSRGMFWAAVAIAVAPLLSQDLPDPASFPSASGVPVAWFGLTVASVLRALFMFNVMIGLQTLTDISILLGGSALPKGMTVAEYAHRGAYPLLATALLAGAFALTTRPFLGEHRAIQPLLLLWITQNVILCAAAMLRLEHYVEAFGLTYLRLYALIWMALVAVGLGLMLWQVVQRRSNTWLVIRFICIGLATLYVCSFVNFSQIIAAQNLNRPNIDIRYMCDLGPMAGAEVRRAMADHPEDYAFVQIRSCDALRPISISSWQEWGFRSWQVGRYIAQNEAGRPSP